jgi:acyl-CoA thioesterase I
MTTIHNRLCFELLSTVATIWLFANVACAWGDEPRDTTNIKVDVAEFVATVLKPFWQTTEIREPIFFVESAGADRPRGRLLFKPTEVLSVTNGTCDLKFEPGKDFTVDLEGGTISVPSGSRIPVTAREHLYPLMTSDLPKIARKSGDRTRGIFFDEGAAYHKLQTEVTYRYQPGQWNGPTPKYAGDLLPKTVAKLLKRQPVKLVLCGDSISLGANASLRTKAPPGCPPFGELTAMALEKHFGSKVTLINQAIDGTTSSDGLQQAKEGKIDEHRPDLFIIAFGMNDVYYGRDPAKFKANIRGMLERVRADAPNTEFILVSPMLANAERGIPLEKLWLYRDALAELAGPGVALADLTSMWGELLKRKSFYDLTGNGVNHPNDFGHCVYAETLLALLIDMPKKGLDDKRR